jgi:hypothetical protein
LGQNGCGKKEGENGEVVRNKSRLVVKGYSQNGGIYYEETFAPVARLEAIRILLAFSVAKGFKLYQMDVKSAFLNGFLEEEVYVKQPAGFESAEFPHRVYRLRKVLHGLKQAPRPWYGRFRGFLFSKGFEMGKVDKTLFLLMQGDDCRMDLPRPTASVGTRIDYSVGPWDCSTCATRHLMAWGARTTVEKYSDRKLYMCWTM